MREKIAATGSFLATTALSFCCTLPLALASLGVGSLGLGAVMRPLRPYMVVVSLAFLSYGFYTVYARRKATKNKVLMWISAALFALVVGIPYVAGVLPTEEEATLEEVDPPGTRRVIVDVDDATCGPECEGRAREALDAIPGVQRVRIIRRLKQAVLTIDEHATLDPDLVSRSLEAADCRGQLRLP